MSGNYVVMEDTTIYDYVYIRKNQTVNLIVQPGVTLICAKGIGCGLDVNNQSATLNIYGFGKIVAIGQDKAAGIGGNDDEASGSINIHGTTIEATGGKHAAGIGGGEGGKEPDLNSPAIRIYAGDITAVGGINGAGIGGGEEQLGARTFIYGGTVTASSEEHGAGIGGGYKDGTVSLWIHGGTINATGGEGAAGIGTGEDAGSLPEYESGYGISILGGTVTATGGEDGAGVGGGKYKKMSIPITIRGEATKLTAVGGDGGAGIAGNMNGSFYMISGNVSVKGGLWAAGIGGGRERGAYVGGEGGTVYIAGGNLTVEPGAGFEGHWYGDKHSKAEAIGSGHNDYVSGTVHIDPDSTGGNYMRVVYNPISNINNDDLVLSQDQTALAADRSKKCHAHSKLSITVCPHTDHNGGSGLTYTINSDNTHTVKCKYCGYEAKEAHTGSDCVCGYTTPNKTVTLNSLSGIGIFAVAEGNSFTLPHTAGQLLAGNTFPTPYYAVVGWQLADDPSGTVYEAGSDVIVFTDMEFTLITDPVYLIEINDPQNGKIVADLTEAKAGETVQFDVEPDTGYSVGSVSYQYITEIDSNNGEYVYIYCDPIEIPAVDGVYQMTMPQLSLLPGPGVGVLVSAAFTKDPEQSIFISEAICDGTIASDHETATAGTLITLTATPDEGYVLDTISCSTLSGAAVELTKVSDAEYTFAMPNESVLVGAEFAELSAWNLLQAAIDAAESGSTITLTGDCVADADNTALVVPAGKTLTIDLNGFAINRNLFAVTENGSAIANNGTLTITDASAAQTGTITGGYNNIEGGGVKNSGTLTIEGGIFTGNVAKEGGAIANKSGATLTMNGGTISDNATYQWAGAGILNKGTMTMNGGTISGNTITAVGMNGAGIWTNSSLTITGGTITGNYSRTGNGGGIYYNGGTLKLSGSPVITGNTALSEDNDLYINGNYVLTIPAALTETAKIGVRFSNLNTNAFTAGLNGKGTAANFRCNHSGYAVGLTPDGEACLGVGATVTFLPGHENATGTMEVVSVVVGSAYTLPGCGYAVPGKAFAGWLIGSETKQPGDGIIVAEDTVVTALWEDRLSDGYYLIKPDWTVDAIDKSNKFEENPNATGEYMLTTTLAEGDQIKVVHVTNNVIDAWYPDGAGTQYTVDAAHSGNATIYFKPSYDSGWAQFGGYFWIVKEPDPAVLAHSISLKDEIGVNFHILLPSDCTAENTEISFTWGGTHSAAATLKTAGSAAAALGANWSVSCFIAAKHMTDKVTMTVQKNGETLLTDTYSVVDYAADFAGYYADNDAMLTLLCNMLDYGGATQNQFGYKTDDLASAYIPQVKADWTRPAAPDSIDVSGMNLGALDLTDYGLTFVGASLMTTSKTAIRLFFTADETFDKNAVTATYGSETLTFTQRGQYWTLELGGISAKEIFTNKTVTLSKSGAADATVTYNVAAYYNSVLAGNYAEKLKTVMKTMYNYSIQARAVLS